MTVYPSPLQELLCQKMQGPHPGKQAWTYHLSEEDEEKDAYLDDEEWDRLPEFRSLVGVVMTIPPTSIPALNPEEEEEVEEEEGGKRSSVYLPHDRTWCTECAADYHIFEPWPESEEEEAGARERRRARYFMQVERVGRRMQICAQLLIDYHCTEPATPLCEGDDSRLWSTFDCFQATTWRFLGPLAVCWREEHTKEEDLRMPMGRVLHLPSLAVFPSFGDLCDMLLESAGYAEKGMVLVEGGKATRGWDRLVTVISQHPELAAFGQGEFFDVDKQLRSYLPWQIGN